MKSPFNTNQLNPFLIFILLFAIILSACEERNSGHLVEYLPHDIFDYANYKIEGVVIGEGGEPLEDVLIGNYSYKPGKQKTCRTDANGRFQFVQKRRRSVSLVYKKSGYHHCRGIYSDDTKKWGKVTIKGEVVKLKKIGKVVYLNEFSRFVKIAADVFSAVTLSGNEPTIVSGLKAPEIESLKAPVLYITTALDSDGNVLTALPPSRKGEMPTRLYLNFSGGEKTDGFTLNNPGEYGGRGCLICI